MANHQEKVGNLDICQTMEHVQGGKFKKKKKKSSEKTSSWESQVLQILEGGKHNNNWRTDPAWRNLWTLTSLT